MLRDDVVVNQDTKALGTYGNYVFAGVLQYSDQEIVCNFSRETSLAVSNNRVSGTYAADDEASFTIKRLGQVVTVTTEYKGKKYTSTYTDFDFVGIDSQYMYIGMAATRGTIAIFTDVEYTYDGVSQGA